LTSTDWRPIRIRRLNARCLRSIEYGFGLPALGQQIRIVQAHKHVSWLDDLTCLQVDLNNAGEKPGANGCFMHGADGPHGRLDHWQPNEAHLG
jgi:hypothetical protein